MVVANRPKLRAAWPRRPPWKVRSDAGRGSDRSLPGSAVPSVVFWKNACRTNLVPTENPWLTQKERGPLTRLLRSRRLVMQKMSDLVFLLLCPVVLRLVARQLDCNTWRLCISFTSLNLSVLMSNQARVLVPPFVINLFTSLAPSFAGTFMWSMLCLFALRILMMASPSWATLAQFFPVLHAISLMWAFVNFSLCGGSPIAQLYGFVPCLVRCHEARARDSAEINFPRFFYLFEHFRQPWGFCKFSLLKSKMSLVGSLCLFLAHSFQPFFYFVSLFVSCSSLPSLPSLLVHSFWAGHDSWRLHVRILPAHPEPGRLSLQIDLQFQESEKHVCKTKLIFVKSKDWFM